MKNGTSASPAMALASSVLPVPGEPTISTPRGILPPSFWNLPGSRRNSTSSPTSSLASSQPATSAKVTLTWSRPAAWRRDLPKRHGAAAAAAALHLPHEVDPDRDQQQDREGVEQQLQQRAAFPWAARRSNLTLCSTSVPIIERLSVSGLMVVKRDAALELAADRAAPSMHDLGDIALLDLVQELGIRQRRLRVRRGDEKLWKTLIRTTRITTQSSRFLARSFNASSSIAHSLLLNTTPPEVARQQIDLRTARPRRLRLADVHGFESLRAASATKASKPSPWNSLDQEGAAAASGAPWRNSSASSRQVHRCRPGRRCPHR